MHGKDLSWLANGITIIYRDDRVVWWSGGLVVWWSGGLVVWRSGGLVGEIATN